MSKWTPRDVIALVLIGGAFILRALGINSLTEWIIIAIAAVYFGASIGRPGKGG